MRTITRDIAFWLKLLENNKECWSSTGYTPDCSRYIPNPVKGYVYMNDFSLNTHKWQLAKPSRTPMVSRSRVRHPNYVSVHWPCCNRCSKNELLTFYCISYARSPAAWPSTKLMVSHSNGAKQANPTWAFLSLRRFRWSLGLRAKSLPPHA